MGLEVAAQVAASQADWAVVNGDASDLIASLPDGSVAACVTDPPYGVSYQSGRCESGPRFDVIEGDEAPAVEWLAGLPAKLADGAGVLVFCEWRGQEAFRAAIESAGLTIRSQVIWDREQHGMGDLQGAFAPCHDCAWFATKGAGFRFHGKRPRSVIRSMRVAAHDLQHPTQKPVDLLKQLVATLCPPGGVVLDPFCGSGTTGVAAVLLGRRAILADIDARYAALATARMEACAAGTDHRTPWQMGLWGAQS